MTNGGKNLSWSNLIIVGQICAVVTKNVRGTKVSNFDHCESVRELRGLLELRSVPESNLLHSLYCSVIVLYDDVVIGIQGVEPRLKTSVQSHGMR